MTTSIDPYIHTLVQLCPTYFTLKDIMDKGPKIFADLSRRGKQWSITRQEEVYSDDVTPIWTNPGALDERVNWTMNQLENWPDVRRMSHDMWYFKRKRDAEKFQTLYNLKWAAE